MKMFFKGIIYLIKYPRYFISAWREHYGMLKQEARQ